MTATNTADSIRIVPSGCELDAVQRRLVTSRRAALAVQGNDGASKRYRGGLSLLGEAATRQDLNPPVAVVGKAAEEERIGRGVDYPPISGRPGAGQRASFVSNRYLVEGQRVLTLDLYPAVMPNREPSARSPRELPGSCELRAAWDVLRA